MATKAKQTKSDDTGVPVENWIQHPAPDWMEWMDKEGPLRVDELTDEQRAAYEKALDARDEAKKA